MASTKNVAQRTRALTESRGLVPAYGDSPTAIFGSFELDRPALARTNQLEQTVCCHQIEIEWRTVLRIFRYPTPIHTAGIALSLLVGICGGGVIFAVEASASSTTTMPGASSPVMSRSEALSLAKSEVLRWIGISVGMEALRPKHGVQRVELLRLSRVLPA